MRRLLDFYSLTPDGGELAMDQDRIEALMVGEFTPERLRPIQIFSLVMGALLPFAVGAFLGRPVELRRSDG